MSVSRKKLALGLIALVTACAAAEVKVAGPPTEPTSPPSSSASVATEETDATPSADASLADVVVQPDVSVDAAPTETGPPIVMSMPKDPCPGGSSTCADAGKMTISCIRRMKEPQRVRLPEPYERCRISRHFSKRVTDDARKSDPFLCCYFVPEGWVGPTAPYTGGLL